MYYDAKCPYCESEQDINHDDGYGFREDELYQQECIECDKKFTFYTIINYDHETHKADCLNGSEHDYAPSHTHPTMMTKMACKECEKRRELTEVEWLNFLKPMEVINGWYK